VLRGTGSSPRTWSSCTMNSRMRRTCPPRRAVGAWANTAALERLTCHPALTCAQRTRLARGGTRGLAHRQGGVEASPALARPADTPVHTAWRGGCSCGASTAARAAPQANLLAALEWLVADAAPGDSLVFGFSGHGTSGAADAGGAALLPCNYRKARPRPASGLQAGEVRGAPSSRPASAGAVPAVATCGAAQS